MAEFPIVDLSNDPEELVKLRELAVSMWRRHDLWKRRAAEIEAALEENPPTHADGSEEFRHSCLRIATGYHRRADEIGAVLRTLKIEHPGPIEEPDTEGTT